MTFLPYSPVNNGITPAFSYFNELNFTEEDTSFSLVFPASFLPSTKYFSAFIRLKQDNDVSGIVLLPDATLGAPGNAAIFYNVSGFNIRIQDFLGNEVTTIEPSVAKEVILTGDASWDVFTLASTTSQVDAAALAGYGLFAEDAKLNIYMPVDDINSTFIIDETYRAQVINWTGGTFTQSLPLASGFDNGFFFYLKNVSYGPNGILTLSATSPNTIDNKATLNLSANQSCIVFTDSVNWFTQGLGALNSDLGARITGQGIEVISGTNSAPSYYFIQTPNTGFFLVTPDIGVTINGAWAMNIGQEGINYIDSGAPLQFANLSGIPYIFLKDMLGV